VLGLAVRDVVQVLLYKQLLPRDLCDGDEDEDVYEQYLSWIEEQGCGKARLRRHSPVHMHVAWIPVDR
jgi:hypothetical protein